MSDAPPDDAWEPWSPAEAARRLAAVEAPWCVVGGWALDLAAGRQQRAHEDLEIAVPADRFDEVAAALGGLELFVPEDHVLRALVDDPGLLERSHQTWVVDDGRWRLDVMREPTARAADGTPLWVCRRDEELRLPYAEVIRRTPDGVPYLRPHLVLFFKANATREKDQGDLERALPRLDPAERTELARLVDRTYGPDHPWSALLSGAVVTDPTA